MSDPDHTDLSRRLFAAAALATLAGGVALARWVSPANATTAGPATGADPHRSVDIENFAATGQSAGVVSVDKLVKSEAEWRAALSPMAYRVTRQEGTEVPFSGEYAASHADGLYRCVCCATALFDSNTKFDSGTGWPSFWQAISAHNVRSNADSSFGMQRDAISCSRCDAHLGHVFDDGPRPTGLRYCMNSVSLNFVPRAS